jgi:hypothetical protein
MVRIQTRQHELLARTAAGQIRCSFLEDCCRKPAVVQV